MIEFNWYNFSALTNLQLYEILALRCRVFVVEQTCCYQDLDGKDKDAIHLFGTVNEQLVSYARLFPPGDSSEVLFGRVVTERSMRDKGYGKQLIREVLAYAGKHFPQLSVKCSAQYYLRSFYEEFGFQSQGGIYDEDNIPHIAMLKKTNNT